MTLQRTAMTRRSWVLQEPVPWQYSIQYDQYVRMFSCSLYFVPVVLTQVYLGTGWLDLESSSVNPRGLPSNSIGMHLKLLHIV